MPTVRRHEGYEVRLNSDEHEPPHVHVWKAAGQVKIWLGSLAAESAEA